MKLDLTPEQLTLVKAILTKNLPPETKVYVFGSRTRGNARKYSDLDLAIDFQGQAFPLSIEAELSYDLEESDLPFKVDIVDLNTISESFRNNITNDLNELNYKS